MNYLKCGQYANIITSLHISKSGFFRLLQEMKINLLDQVFSNWAPGIARRLQVSDGVRGKV